MLRVLPMGPHAVLVDELPAEPAAWALGVRALDIAGVIDVVPAAETVLITCTGPGPLRDVLACVGDVQPATSDAAPDQVILDVIYDGADLADVAAACSMTVPEVIAAHSGATYRVAFCGFAPGFGYLTGLPTALHLPRLPSPRTAVPAGAVAVAAEYSAVYPRSSPGGWNLIGRTDAVLFDPTLTPPSRLSPGTTVHFRAVT